MWNELLVAVALVLVLEGIFPFLAPEKFKQALAQLGPDVRPDPSYCRAREYHDWGPSSVYPQTGRMSRYE